MGVPFKRLKEVVMHEILFTLNNEKEQRDFGIKLAQAFDHKTLVIYLQGDLGAGKTTLARGFMQGLGYEGKVKSPTYTLVEVYPFGNLKVLHIDLYRIETSEEIFELGLRDFFEGEVVYLVEWAEKAKEMLPPPDITCYISPFEKGRICRVVFETPRAQEMVDKLCENGLDIFG
jgi:tRNA threonylcarbamoyladenosine biosynthesis protein TsaE